MSVTNKDRGGSVTGPVHSILGWAAQDNPNTAPGELSVHLQGVPVAAPYWVVALGPEHDNKYDWAVVSDPTELSLFVLTRNVTRFNALYNASVYAMLLNEGFNTPINTPIATIQDGCPPPTVDGDEEGAAAAPARAALRGSA